MIEMFGSRNYIVLPLLKFKPIVNNLNLSTMNTTTTTSATTTQQTTVKNNFKTKLFKLLTNIKNIGKIKEGAPYVTLPSNFKGL